MPAVDVDVVIGVVYTHNKSKVLLLQQREDQHYAGLWVFPGGKRAAKESAFCALKRELHEEVGITVRAARPLIKLRHQQQERNIVLDVWQVEQWHGRAVGREKNPVRWVAVEQLAAYRTPDANRSIIMAIQLPSLYLISPDLLACDFDPVDKLRSFLARGLKLFQLRCADVKTAAYTTLANKLSVLCAQYQAMLMMNIEPQYIKQYKAAGVHLSSRRLMQLEQRPLDHSYRVSASCHNLTELQHAAAIGIDFVTLSPVSATNSHPGATPLGWDTFSQLTAAATVPVYALGGMCAKDQARAWQAGAQGLAIISAVWNEDPAADCNTHLFAP